MNLMVSANMDRETDESISPRIRSSVSFKHAKQFKGSGGSCKCVADDRSSRSDLCYGASAALLQVLVQQFKLMFGNALPLKLIYSPGILEILLIQLKSSNVHSFTDSSNRSFASMWLMAAKEYRMPK